ncbi:hypothetical protein MMC18_005074 [Xylographa bjoerkii]|nr:hypothetical protein [Xylographa bjoerkii]
MTTNIVILDLPHSTLVGIDLLCFTSSPQFQGIANVPPGWHFLFTSPTTSLSIHHGTWFFTISGSASEDKPDGARRAITHSRSTQSNVLVFQWSNAKEELAPVVDEAALSAWGDQFELNDENVKRLRRGLFPYRQTASKQPSSSIVPSRDVGHTSHVSKDIVDNSEFVEELTDWPLLVAHLSHELLERVTNPIYPSTTATGTVLSAVPRSVLTVSKFLSVLKTAYYTLTTSSTSPEDRDDIPGLSPEDARDGLFGHEENELGFLGINLKKTWRDGAVGRERTEGARDRSWALQETVQRSQQPKSESRVRSGKDFSPHALQEAGFHSAALGPSSQEHLWGMAVLGEMELCFLAVLTQSNYSCLEEWKRVLTLVLTSYGIISSQPRFFAASLDLLRCQLTHCDDVEGGLFDIGLESGSGEGNLLRRLLSGFKTELEEIEG